MVITHLQLDEEHSQTVVCFVFCAQTNRGVINTLIHKTGQNIIGSQEHEWYQGGEVSALSTKDTKRQDHKIILCFVSIYVYVDELFLSIPSYLARMQHSVQQLLIVMATS